MKDIITLLTEINGFSSDSWKTHHIYNLLGNLELIQVVHNNYRHIDQLEKLQNLFNKYVSSYEDSIQPDARVFYKLCYEICRLTIKSHYNLLSGIETQYHIDTAFEIVKTYYTNIK